MRRLVADFGRETAASAGIIGFSTAFGEALGMSDWGTGVDLLETGKYIRTSRVSRDNLSHVRRGMSWNLKIRRYGYFCRLTDSRSSLPWPNQKPRYCYTGGRTHLHPKISSASNSSPPSVWTESSKHSETPAVAAYIHPHRTESPLPISCTWDALLHSATALCPNRSYSASAHWELCLPRVRCSNWRSRHPGRRSLSKEK
jgi:hypothetical protein